MSNNEAIIRTAEQPNSRTAEQPNSLDSALRVLYISLGSSSVGGADLALLNLMLDMKHRHNIQPVFLVGNEGDLIEECRKNGIEVITEKYYGWFDRGYDPINRLKGLVKHLLNKLYLYRKIINILKNKHLDIIHTNSSWIQIGDLAAESLGIPHVWHIRDCITEHFGYKYTLNMDYVHSRFNASAANITVSQAVYNNVINIRKYCSPANTRTIYDGVKITAPYEKSYCSDGRMNFCMIGRVYSGKNQIMAVRAAQKLRAKTDKFTLHLIGPMIPEEYTEEIMQLVHSAGLDDHVKLWGSRPEAAHLLKTMDVGLMLSAFEGFGLVTAEYMMNYMPVIGVNTGATPELVRDSENGFICPFDDTDTLAELMHRFIANPELLQTLGSNGRQIAVREFSVERNTDEIYALYQEILHRN